MDGQQTEQIQKTKKTSRRGSDPSPVIYKTMAEKKNTKKKANPPGTDPGSGPGVKPGNFDLLIPHQFKPGQSGNPAGRPRKFVTLMKDAGYKQTEINDTLRALLVMTEDELQDIKDHPESTILERVAAAALLKGLNSSSLFNLELLMSRTFGSPKQQIDNKHEYTGPLEIIHKTTGVGLARSEDEVRAQIQEET